MHDAGTPARRYPARKHAGHVVLPPTLLLFPFGVCASAVLCCAKRCNHAARCRRAFDTRHRALSSALSPRVSTGGPGMTANTQSPFQ